METPFHFTFESQVGKARFFSNIYDRIVSTVWSTLKKSSRRRCYDSHKLLGLGGGFGDAGHHFYDFIREHWRNPELDPQEFHEARLVMLPKSGNLSNPNKGRGICLLGIAIKIVSSITADRLQKVLEKTMLNFPSQA
mmetsp:Transcript_22155/g.22469  ORF Transcript_22155/g.22469 Transcript_22155/m.22469 type:complete len:137 (+) Transcript_22155:121-531(+)